MKRALVTVSLLLTVALAFGAGVDGDASTTDVPGEGAPQVEAEATEVTQTDVFYATWEERPLTLDIHVPAEPADAPVVVYLPGSGQRHAPPEVIERLIENGVIVAIVRYAAGFFAPEVILTARSTDARSMADSVACALHMVRDRAARLGSVDPVVILTGFSLGGAPAAHAALFGSDLERRWEAFAAEGGTPRQVECEVAAGSTHVDALVGLSGAYDILVPAFDGKFGRGYQQARNAAQWRFLADSVGLDPGLTVRLIHGTADATIPFDNSVGFATVLSEAGYDVHLISFDGGHEVEPELTASTILGLLGR